jgi:DDE superfamily endonuclease
MALAVNAIGTSIPPIFIFPLKRYKEMFIRGGPVGCIGTANGSGWMQEEDFLIFLQHFVSHVRPSKSSPALLIMDNHSSHVNVKVIDYCKNHGIILLTFPPHCSHKLQPLDRSLFGPLKRYYNMESDCWMKSHPGRTMSMYDIPELVSRALPKAATPSNITAGFACTGIYPFDPDIFSDIDFMPSNVTDRPDPQDRADSELVNTSTPMASGIEGPSETEMVEEMQPELVCPLPKAGPRKDTQQKGRKKKPLPF